MNHLEGRGEDIISRITPSFIDFIKEENKKYEKSTPPKCPTSKYPYIAYQIEKEKERIRKKHQRRYKALTRMFPNSVIRHQWIEKTSEYEGVALVEENAHQHNRIEIIKVLEGKITIF